ncbi:MAG: Crp/Fnr family transcriptional regulator [Thiobacillaceae bacterium]
MPVHPNFLSHIDLLRALPEALRVRLAERMSRRELPRRAVAQQKGAHAAGLGFVIRGRLQAVDFTLDGREAGLYFVGPGEHFGELAVIDGEPAPEYIVAICHSEVLELPAADARELLLPVPEVAAALARRLAARVREGFRLRTLLALGNPMQRLCAQLAHLAGAAGAIDHAPTHQELAIMINTTRETVTRNMQQLLTQQVVRRDGERLVILMPEILAALARGDSSV